MADNTHKVDEVVESEDREILDIPQSIDARIRFIDKERKHVIQALALQSRRAKGIPDRSDAKIEALFIRLDRLLLWLDLELEMTPKIREKSKIDQGLEVIFNNAQFKFPQQYADQAQTLYEKWEGENWGKSAAIDDVAEFESGSDPEVESEPQAKRRKTSTTTRAKKDPRTDDTVAVATLKLPRSDDPIFGKESYMFGVAAKHGKNKGYVLDPRYMNQKRNFKVYGHNGLAVGTWFPYLKVALFHGAHGAPMAGISGDKENGAYSVVVSGMYETLDQDRGENIFYSGSGSHDNENPNRPAPSTNGTLALHASLASHRPVRVLRSSRLKSEYAPFYGYRYDGLYEVVNLRTPRNEKGGLYEQFKLRRLEDQEPIAMNRPSPTERRAFEKITR